MIGLTLPDDLIQASPGYGAKILYDVNLTPVDLSKFTILSLYFSFFNVLLLYLRCYMHSIK